MNTLKENIMSLSEKLPRAAAIIIASRPLERDERGVARGDDQEILPALIRVGRISLIERVIIRLQTAGVAPIVVITGFKSGNLQKHLAKMNVVNLHNPYWRETSVVDDAIKGLSYIERSCCDCEKILLATPLIHSFDATSLTRLLVTESTVAVPVHEGKEGLPIVIHRDTVRKLTRAEKGSSLAEFIAAASGTVERVVLDDPGILPDVVTSEELENRELSSDGVSKLPMRVRFKLSLAREEVFFGPGPAVLLRLIDETGSVRMACEQMKLSYSKGWQILNLLEEQLRDNVIVRKPGGQEGGSSTLTDAGHELLRRYEQLAVDTQHYVNERFDQLFNEFFED